jgi:hypothetical protein
MSAVTVLQEHLSFYEGGAAWLYHFTNSYSGPYLPLPLTGSMLSPRRLASASHVKHTGGPGSGGRDSEKEVLKRERMAGFLR